MFCPSRCKPFIAQWHTVVHVIRFGSRTDLRFLVVKSAKVLPWAIFGAAWVCPVVSGVVEQLLGPMSVWTSNAEWASLLVRQPGILLIPKRTWLYAVPNRWLSSGILESMRVSTCLPVMLCTDWAPQCLELLSKKICIETITGQLLLLLAKKRCAYLIPSMCKSTRCTTTTL